MKIFDLSQNWWQLIIVAVACYLIGCFNFAKIISLSKKKDITTIGSGNPGTMNMSREFGLGVGLLTFFCDVLKGGLPALIGYFIYKDYVFANTLFSVSDFMRYFCGLFVIIGHIFPVFMKFKGGKGIASTFGLFWLCLACESPWWLLFGFLIMLGVVLVIFLTEMGSLGSLIGVTAFSIVQMIMFVLRYSEFAVNVYMVLTYAFILAINILTWAAHHENVMRLFSGEEHRTSIKKLSKKKK